MQLPFFHQHCLQPISVQCGDGTFNYVPCGHCRACQLAKQSSWSKRLEADIKFAKLFPVFFTLTYNNKNLPLVYYDEDEMPYKLEFTSVRRLPSNTKNYKTTDVYDKLTGSWYRYERKRYKPSITEELSNISLSNLHKPHYVTQRINNNFVYNSDNCFAISYLPDIQNFFKRLRQAFSYCPSLNKEDNSFTYFLCSEYGPQTFRPHYHGILFFRSRKSAHAAIDHLISLCWGKQDNDINRDSPIASFVMSSEAAASYVSTYVAIASNLPPLFRLAPFKPIRTSSKSCPIGSLSFDLNNIPSMLDKNDLFFYKSFIHPETKEHVILRLTYPDATFNRVFPKFCLSRLLDASTKYSIFHRLYKIALSIKSNSESSQLPDYSSTFDTIISRTEPIYQSKLTTYYVIHPTLTSRDYDYLHGDHNIFLTKDHHYLLRYKYYEKKLVDVQQQTYKLTPSLIFTNTDDIRNNLDLYLFGIAQNRAACRKIINNFINLSWCNNPLYYCDLYNMYFTKRFSLTLSTYYDQCLSLPHVTPFDLANIYRSKFDSLPDDLSIITETQYKNFDLFISTYGLDITHFYDSNGKKYPFSFLSSDIGILYNKHLNQKIARQQVIKQHNHTYFNEK